MHYFHELTFDDGTITPQEYLYLVEFVRQNRFKRILEFGPGFSTYAFLENDSYTNKLIPCEYRRPWVYPET